jgi:hypothetical protein
MNVVEPSAHGYHDTAQTANATPFQSLNLSMANMPSVLASTLPGSTRAPARRAVR